MDANRTKLGIIKEATFNLVPATPAFEILRITGSELTYTPRTVVSAELRDDLQVSDLIRVGYEAGGRVPMEVSYGALNSQVEGALRSLWSTRFLTKFNTVASSPITSVTGATSIYAYTGGETPVAGDLYRASGFGKAVNNGIMKVIAGSGAGSLKTNTVLADEAAPPAGAQLKKCGVEFAVGVISIVGSTLVRSAGSWITDGIVPGEWLKLGSSVVGGCAFTITPADNAWVRVGSVLSATVLILDVVPTGWADDAGTGKTIRIFYGEYIRNGTTPTSFTLEMLFEDLVTPEYHMFSGMRVNTLSLEAAQQDILKAVVEFMGASASILTARTGGASDLPQETNDVLNTSSNVGRLAEAGTDLTGSVYVTGASIEINTNLRRQNAIANLGSFGIGQGRTVVTGKLSTYYQSKQLLDKLRAGTATSYDMRVMDPDGSRALVMDLPRIKFTTGAPTVPGIDSDRMLELPFQALRHVGFNYTIHMQRFEGVEA